MLPLLTIPQRNILLRRAKEGGAEAVKAQLDEWIAQKAGKGPAPVVIIGKPLPPSLLVAMSDNAPLTPSQAAAQAKRDRKARTKAANQAKASDGQAWYGAEL